MSHFSQSTPILPGYACFILAFLLGMFLPQASVAQDDLPVVIEEEWSEGLSLSLEYRPRTELRRGYRSLPADTSKIAFQTSHRGRLALAFRRDRFLFRAIAQDIRVWGDTDTRDADGKMQFYEFFVQPFLTDDLSVRVGRQRILYDNERLFAENNWRQAGGQHDAVRWMYNREALDMDLIMAFNQNKTLEFGTRYDVPWDTYKVLLAHFISYRPSPVITLTGINFTDGYEAPDGSKTHFKWTNGGRFTYRPGSFNWTVAGYYQHGRIKSGESHRAYYLEPEIAWQAKPGYELKAGMQLLSGDNNPGDGVSNAFLAQYGAFHAHNGRMDFTQLTVRTYNHPGITNPYIKQDLSLGKKYRLLLETHLLGNSVTLRDESGAELEPFYGLENDLRLIYRPNGYTTIEAAYMLMIPGRTLEYIPAGTNGSASNLPQFGYLAVSWTPDLLKKAGE